MEVYARVRASLSTSKACIAKQESMSMPWEKGSVALQQWVKFSKQNGKHICLVLILVYPAYLIPYVVATIESFESVFNLQPGVIVPPAEFLAGLRFCLVDPNGNLLSRPQFLHCCTKRSIHGFRPSLLLFSMKLLLVEPAINIVSHRLQIECLIAGDRRI